MDVRSGRLACSIGLDSRTLGNKSKKKKIFRNDMPSNLSMNFRLLGRHLWPKIWLVGLFWGWTHGWTPSPFASKAVIKICPCTAHHFSRLACAQLYVFLHGVCWQQWEVAEQRVSALLHASSADHGRTRVTERWKAVRFLSWAKRPS